MQQIGTVWASLDRRKQIVVAGAVVLVFLGILSLRELPVQNLPEITFPAMYYTARVRDADLSPEKTNDEITRPFEKMVASLPGIREMRSTTRGGFFWGYARFQTGTDMRFRPRG